MSESTLLRVNGHHDTATDAPLPAPGSRLRSRSRKAHPAATPRKVGKSRRLSIRRKLAIAIGGVGTGVLALSVVHCAEAVQLLTGSHWALAGLLAIGIDLGMLGSELAELAAHGSRREGKVTLWARAYLVVAV